MIDLFSYIEAGTIVIIWQVIAGIFITLGVVFAIWWRKITTFLKSLWVKLFGKKDKADKKAENVEEKVDDELGELDNEESKNE